jgi:hypothetical protein
VTATYNQLIATLQGAFSRAFWFGSFLPVALVAAAHLLVLEVARPGSVPFHAWLEQTAGAQAVDFAILLIALIVLAYALAPIAPLVRSILDGQILPKWLHDRLRQDRLREWQDARKRFEDAANLYGGLRVLQGELGKIHDAQNAGNGTKQVTEEALIHAAELAVAALRAAMAKAEAPDVETAFAARDALVQALQKNASDLPAASPHGVASARLARIRDEFIDFTKVAMSEAAYRWRRASFLDNRPDLFATRAGEARRQTERYTEDTYGVDFDFLWTRIQMLLPKEADAYERQLGDAQSQVNFSVLTLALSVTVPLAWLPYLACTAETPWLFLLIAVASPLAFVSLYGLAVQSQLAFGETVRAGIDKYRLAVLTELLRQPLPTTLATERLLWKQVQAASEPENSIDLAFHHKASS